MDFQKDVLERSFEIPVVVDFWAPWCGPCRVLTPVIEQLAEEQKGQWELVKVNTEEFEDIARKYHIMSIPNVKMFYLGEVRHEFLGAIPKTKIQEWLQKVLPSKGLRALDQFLLRNPNPSVADLEALNAAHPESQEIAFVLSQLLMWEEPDRSVELLKGVRMGSPFFQKAEHVRDIAAFINMETNDPEVDKIKQLLRQSRLTEAIPAIIDYMQTHHESPEGNMAKATVGIFNLLGTQHELTKEHRKKFDMVLWK